MNIECQPRESRSSTPFDRLLVALLFIVAATIVSPSGSYSGIGFAIPVDTVNQVVPEIINHSR